MVQTAHIRNLGYPVWLSFDAFIERFGLLEVLPIRKQNCFTRELDFYNLGLVHTDKKISVFKTIRISLLSPPLFLFANISNLVVVREVKSESSLNNIFLTTGRIS